jgi:hypothetical protein
MEQIDHLIFQHIPKAAGMSVQNMLRWQYRGQPTFMIEMVAASKVNEDLFTEMPPDRRDRIRLLTGHRTFGMHRYFSGQTKYITLLRHPLKRIPSYYYFVKARPKHRLYQQAFIDNDYSLSDFVRNIRSHDLNNGQVTLLIEKDTAPEVRVEQALKNLDEWFIAAGLTERFEESICLFATLLGWGTPYYLRTNQGRDKQRAALTEEEKAVITEFNREDLALYERAEERLNSQLEAHAVEVAAHAERLHRKGAFMSRLIWLREARRRCVKVARRGLNLG